MTIKKYKPTSNGRHSMTGSGFAEITASTPEKSLLQPLRNHAGHSSNGHITVHHQGSGRERQYHVIGFECNKDNVIATVQTIEYGPDHSTSIALVRYEDGVKTYVLAPKGLEVGMKLVSSPEADIKVGNALPLENIPAGTIIHNIEMKSNKGGQLIRSAGASAQVLGKEGKYVLIRLNSGEVHMTLTAYRTTIGFVGGEQHRLIDIGKAGRSRWMCERPAVRGSVMNLNDHPHGGGKSRAPTGRKTPVSPWDQPALGYKTCNKKAKSGKLIIRRCKNK